VHQQLTATRKCLNASAALLTLDSECLSRDPMINFRRDMDPSNFEYASFLEEHISWELCRIDPIFMT
jgi:hypothetical protein